METSDADLLEAHVRGDPTAFAALAERYAGLVYAAARRRVHDPAAADDVTQAAFMVLAAKARSLQSRPTVAGWLLVVTRQVAMTANRAAVRRRRHERSAARPGHTPFTPPDDAPDPAALIDDALASLGTPDRDAIMLRFFENRSLADVARALGTGEDAARKRVGRAVEKLRGYFARRGVVMNAAGVTAAVIACVSPPAPAAVVAHAAAASTQAATPLAKGTLLMLAAKKAAVVMLVGLTVGGTGMLAVVARTPSRQAAAPASEPAATRAAVGPPTPSPATRPTATVTGRVRSADGKPADRAAVILFRQDDDRGDLIAATARAGPDGRFELPVASNLRYPRIAADLPGVGLTPSQAIVAGRPVELVFEPPAEVPIALVGPAGAPVAGLRVWPKQVNFAGASVQNFRYRSSAEDDLKSWAVVTDADGVAAFAGLPSGGRVVLATDDPRFATMTYDDGVAVEANAAFPPPPVKLLAAANVDGRVTYADTGKPVAGVRIYAQNYNAGPTSFGDATTDADGRYAIGRLKPGSFAVCVDNRSPPPDWCAAAARVTLAEGGHGRGDFTLVHGGVITGHVRDAKTGAGLAGLYVGAHSPAHPSEASGVDIVKTDANGAYAIRVPPGKSQVYFANSPPDGYLPPPNANADTKESTEVAEGQTVVGRDFALPPDPTPVVTGVVTDDAGRPVENAVVTAESDRDSFSEPQAVTDAAGRFRLKVRPGTKLRARSADLATVRPVKAAKLGTDTAVRLTRDARFALDVAVVDAVGVAIPTADLQLIAMTGSYGTSGQARPVDATGRLRFDGLYKDTSYSVEAVAVGYGPAQHPLPAPAAGQAVAGLTLTLLKADRKIAGTLLDAAGRPVAGADVGLTGVGARGMTTQTDAAGRFGFDVAADAHGTVYVAGPPADRRPPPSVPAKAGQTDLLLRRPAGNSPATSPGR